MTKRILIVCEGNIRRSPMDEALWNHRQMKFEIPTSSVSTGFAAIAGEAVYRTAKRLLLEKGIDLSGQRSRPLILAMFQDADLVLAMKIWHKPRRQWLAPFALGGFTLLTPGKGIKFPTRIMNQR